MNCFWTNKHTMDTRLRVSAVVCVPEAVGLTSMGYRDQDFVIGAHDPGGSGG